MPPHIFAIADNAYVDMLQGEKGTEHYSTGCGINAYTNIMLCLFTHYTADVCRMSLSNDMPC